MTAGAGKASVTVDVTADTPLSVAPMDADRMLIMVGGEQSTAKFALVMPASLADLLGARITAARIGQLRDRMDHGFVTLSEAAASGLVQAAEARLRAECGGDGSADVVDISTRRRP